MKNWREIEGLVSDDECEVLQELARGKVCVEIGSWKGKSTAAMAEVAKEVIAIDTFKASTDAPMPLFGQKQEDNFTTLEDFVENTKDYDNINVFINLSENVVGEFQEKTIDLLFIDGMHDFDSVHKDVINYIPLLKDDAIIAFHDYGKRYGFESVTKVVDILFGKENIQNLTRGLCWVYKKDFKKVAIATVLTDGYVPYFITLIKSMMANCYELLSLPMVVITGEFDTSNLPTCSEENKNTYEFQNIVSSGLSEVNRQKIKALHPNIIFRDLGFLKREEGKTIPRPIYWHIEAFRLSEFDRAIFIDSDTLCVGDLTDLAAMNCDMGACGIDEDFNFGVFVINKKFLNEETYNAIMLLDPKENKGHGCQDMLIDFFKGQITSFSDRFNFLSPWTNYMTPNNVSLIHYTYKPDTKFGRDRLPIYIIDLWESYKRMGVQMINSKSGGML